MTQLPPTDRLLLTTIYRGRQTVYDLHRATRYSRSDILGLLEELEAREYVYNLQLPRKTLVALTAKGVAYCRHHHRYQPDRGVPADV
jgi:DNA-binding MarR family transcriptional regulator